MQGPEAQGRGAPHRCVAPIPLIIGGDVNA